MDTWEALDAMLRTDERDVGCAQTFALVHRYAEIALRGGDPEAELPGISAHLAVCGPCAEDYEGLLSAVRVAGDARP